MLVLLGPSGCGKTTTLRSVAGLETPSSGEIYIGGVPVFDHHAGVNRKPSERSVGMVFQSYALWPHMTVAENISYPLVVGKRGTRRSRTEARSIVQSLAGRMECDRLLDRYPAQLSGGQQQRVALARALVAEPDLVLFDEPLSNLDADLRRRVRSYLAGIHKSVGFTGVYVTHDQAEAWRLGTHVGVMMDGVLAQLGSPQAVFQRPQTSAIASFLGLTNSIALDRNALLELEGESGLPRSVHAAMPDDGSTMLSFRPESAEILVERDQRSDRISIGPGVVTTTEFGGSNSEVTLMIDESQVQGYAGARVSGIEPGAEAFLSIDRELAMIYADGRLVANGSQTLEGGQSACVS